MQASMSVWPSSWKVSTNFSGVPRTSRKWTKKILPCFPKWRIAAGRSSVIRREVALAERDAVDRAGHHVDQALEVLDAAHDPARCREWVRAAGRPGACASLTFAFSATGHDRFQEVASVLPQECLLGDLAILRQRRVLHQRVVEAGGKRAAACRACGGGAHPVEPASSRSTRPGCPAGPCCESGRWPFDLVVAAGQGQLNLALVGGGRLSSTSSSRPSLA